MIWTKEQNEIRQMDNLLYNQNETCRTCQWSNYSDGDEIITCGHHLQNFTSKSFCCYWTDPNDPNLVEFLRKKKKFLNKKINRVETIKSKIK